MCCNQMILKFFKKLMILGLVADSITHPIDTIRTRVQVQVFLFKNFNILQKKNLIFSH